MALDLAATSDLLRALADPARLRLAALVRREELSVADLVRITRLPQSRVSTHLAKLKSALLLRDRRAGTSTLWSFHPGLSPETVRRVAQWLEAAADPVLLEDAERLEVLLRERELGGAGGWADAVAGSMERHYSPGRTWEATAWGTLGLARLGDVLDVGAGDGVIAELLALRSRSVTCIERSSRVAAAGARRVQQLAPAVRYVRADMHRLPFPAARFDQALLMNALTYVEDVGVVLREAARVLRPGGQLVATTLHRHAHAAEVAPYDHRQLGFEPAQLNRELCAAGFEVELCAVTSRERRKPHFEVITVHASLPAATRVVPHAAPAAATLETSPLRGSR